MDLTDQHNPIVIAVIGAGLIGKKHAHLVANHPDTTLACIVDPTPNGSQLAAEHNVSHYTDITTLLQSSSKVTAAIIATPNNTHVEIGLQLASHGIHLLVEKPLSTSSAEGQVLLKHCRDNNINIVVAHHRRHNPFIRASQHQLQSGSIGRVLAVSATWATLKPKDYFSGIGTWRAGAKGGVVLINAIHDIDILQMLLGPITRVYAEKSPSTRNHEAEEGVAVTLRFKSGVIGTLLVVDNCPSPHNFEAGTGENPAFPLSGQDCYRIFGEGGSLSIPDGKVWVPREREKGWNSELGERKFGPEVVDDAYVRQLGNFVGVVRGRETAACSGEDGLRAVAVCEAIRMSLGEMLPVDVETVVGADG